MLFIVAGVPNTLFNRFQQLVLKTFGDGHHIVAKPLRPRHDGKYSLSVSYARELIEIAAESVAREPSISSKGCGVVALTTPGLDTQTFLDCFHPFALGLALELPLPTLTSGIEGRQTINKIANDIASRLPGLRDAIKAMNVELSARRNRTPLLLPRRNFASDIFQDEVFGLARRLASCSIPNDEISEVCNRIETAHPFRRNGGSSFYDDRNVRFRMPGRALHGRPSYEGHQPTCLLNAFLRLGGATLGEFHYDCTRGDNAQLRGQFPNCHDSVSSYRGSPHLNIAPNDFIR